MTHKERVFHVLLALLTNGGYETGSVLEQSGRVKVIILAGKIVDEFERQDAVI